MRIAVIALIGGLVPGLAAAAGPDPSAMTCAAYGALAVEDQVGVLSTLEPLGDEINASDAAAARQWAAAVTTACRGNPDRLVSDAARDAMGE